jgi:O-antigen/teichoic acid export membrane protein
VAEVSWVHGSRIKRNSLFAGLSQLIRLLANFVLFVGIARLYGPEAFGQFTAAHTLGTIFLLLGDFGFDVLLSTEVSRRRHQLTELAFTYFSAKILFATSAALLMLFVASLQHVSQATQTLMEVFCLFVLFSSLTNYFFALFRSVEELHYETWISFVMNSAMLGTLAVLGVFHASLLTISLAFVASRLLGLLVALATSRHLLRWSEFRFALPSGEQFRQISVFGLYAIFGTLLFTQDTILLSWWAGDAAVGVYQSVMKLVSLALLLSDISFYTLLPVLSRLHETENERWLAMGRLLHKTLAFLVLPMSFIMIVFPREVIALLYGLQGYGEAVPILRVFGWVLLVRYSVEASAMMLTSSRRQSWRLVFSALACGLNYGLNQHAIPQAGAWGAAVVSLITNLALGCGFVLAARRDVLAWWKEWRTYVPLLVALCLGALLWDGRYLSPYVSAPVSLAIIVITILHVGYLREERDQIFSFDRSVLSLR